MRTTTLEASSPCLGPRRLVDRVKAWVRMADLARRCLWIATATVLWFSLVAAVDAGSVLEGSTRAALLAAWGLLALLAAQALFLVPLLRPVTDPYAARLVEAAHPCGHGLVTLFHRPAAGLDPRVAALLARTVSPRLSAVRARRLLAGPDRSAVGHAVGLLLATTGGSALALALAGVPPAEAARRVLLPGAEAAIAPAGRIVRVEPGDTAVVRGSDLSVRVVHDGVALPREAWVEVQRPGAPPRRLPLLPDRSATMEAVIDSVEGALAYRVVVDGVASENFRVEAVEAPSFESVEVHYRYPAYLGLEPRVQPGGDVDAVEGTLARVVARTTKAARSVRFLLDGQPPRVMDLLGDREAFLDLEVRADARYALVYTDADGFASPQGRRYGILCRPDRAPLVRVRWPARDMTVNRGDSIEVRYEASDDFGLARVRLHYQVLRDDARARVLHEAIPDRTLRGELTISPVELGMLPGDRMLYFLSAEDRRLPEPNVGTSPSYFLEVAEDSPRREALTGLDEEEETTLSMADEETPPDLEGLDPEALERRLRESLARLEELSKETDRLLDRLDEEGEDPYDDLEDPYEDLEDPYAEEEECEDCAAGKPGKCKGGGCRAGKGGARGRRTVGGARRGSRHGSGGATGRHGPDPYHLVRGILERLRDPERRARLEDYLARRRALLRRIARSGSTREAAERGGLGLPPSLLRALFGAGVEGGGGRIFRAPAGVHGEEAEGAERPLAGSAPGGASGEGRAFDREPMAASPPLDDDVGDRTGLGRGDPYRWEEVPEEYRGMVDDYFRGIAEEGGR
ncbi:MAG: hypothetical protein HY722_08865 [Planctomycetes bacterium]|nr:hypothetical protein [Planctomycetota bacterium]